jgi:hypothetical protein
MQGILWMGDDCRLRSIMIGNSKNIQQSLILLHSLLPVLHDCTPIGLRHSELTLLLIGMVVALGDGAILLVGLLEPSFLHVIFPGALELFSIGPLIHSITVFLVPKELT